MLITAANAFAILMAVGLVLFLVQYVSGKVADRYGLELGIAFMGIVLAALLSLALASVAHYG